MTNLVPSTVELTHSTKVKSDRIFTTMWGVYLPNTKPMTTPEMRGQTILQIIRPIVTRYVPDSGCENCWGDLGIGCTDACKANWKLSKELEGAIIDLLTTIAREAKREVLEKVITFNTQQAVSGDPMNGYEQYDELVSPELHKFLVGLLAELNDGEVV